MTSPSLTVAALSVLLLLASTALPAQWGPPQEVSETEAANGEKIPIDGPLQYDVEFLGLTCGHVTLESRRETYQGRDAYHIIMRAWNSKFFNGIYKVDGRIDSWTDAQTMNGIAYESVITEKGKTSIKSYRIDQEEQQVVKDDNGKIETIPFEGEAGLDPLAFLFRSRLLAETPGQSFALQLITDDGPLKTMSEVGELKRKRTRQGYRNLLPVEPLPASGEMFSRKGRFVMWVESSPERTLYRFYFKLGFGRLSAELENQPPDR